MAEKTRDIGRRYYRVRPEPPAVVGQTYRVLPRRLTPFPWLAVYRTYQYGEHTRSAQLVYGDAWETDDTRFWTHDGALLNGLLRAVVVIPDPMPLYRLKCREALELALRLGAEGDHPARVKDGLAELVAGLKLYDELGPRPDDFQTDSFREWRVWWEESCAMMRMAGYGMEKRERWLFDLACAAEEYIQEVGAPSAAAYETFVKAQRPDGSADDHERVLLVVAEGWRVAWEEGTP